MKIRLVKKAFKAYKEHRYTPLMKKVRLSNLADMESRIPTDDVVTRIIDDYFWDILTIKDKLLTIHENSLRYGKV